MMAPIGSDVVWHLHVTIAMDEHYETWTAHFIRYVIRQISRRPDYHCRNLDAELIDFIKDMKNFVI
jgi:hypothetical protein